MLLMKEGTAHLHQEHEDQTGHKFKRNKLTKQRSSADLTSFNIDEIKKIISCEQDNLLSMPLLKRMRKYQLISSTKPFEGRIIPGIAPCLNYRIIKLDKETK